MKGNAKLAFDIKIMTKNGVIFCVYLQREYKIAAILASTGTTMSIEKAHMMTKHHDEEQYIGSHWNGMTIEERTNGAMQSLLNWESDAISSQQA